MVVDAFIHEKTTIIEIELNGETIQTTMEHPFWVERKRWVEASRLKPGDIIRLANGNHAVIENINIVQLDKPILVYNFEVADYHTYYVMDIGVLVHNACIANVNNSQRLLKDTKIKQYTVSVDVETGGSGLQNVHIVVDGVKYYQHNGFAGIPSKVLKNDLVKNAVQKAAELLAKGWK